MEKNIFHYRTGTLFNHQNAVRFKISTSRGTCAGKSAVHPRKWVWGSNPTEGSQPAKLPSSGGYSLES